MDKETRDEFLEDDLSFLKPGGVHSCGTSSKRNGSSFTRRILSPRNVTAKGSIAITRSASGLAKKPLCSVCGKTFTLESHLRRHMMIHTRLRLHECKICKQLFSRKDHLRSHVSRIHITCKCLYCNCSFNDKRIFQKHLAHHSRSSSRISQHKSVDRKSLPRRSAAKLAWKKESATVNKQCVWCRKVFDSLKSLKVHIALVHKPYKCKVCKVRLTTSVGLQRHEETHKTTSHQCDFCGNIYSRGDTLRRHVRRLHSEIISCLKCKYCGKSFNHKHSLSFHHKHLPCQNGRVKHDGADVTRKRKHCGVCKLCRKPFYSNRDLYKHVYSHLSDRSGDRKEVIPKLKAMLEDKEYKCSQCDARFSKRLSLCLHRRIHLGHAEYKCEHCRATFKDFKSLKTHLQEHPDEQFTCTLCEWSCTLTRDLIRHVKKIHCKQVNCHLCSKKYNSTLDLSNHLRRTHFVDSKKHLGSEMGKFKTVALKDFTINITSLFISDCS